MTFEGAALLLLRAYTLSQHVPYIWAHIDKPSGKPHLAIIPFPFSSRKTRQRDLTSVKKIIDGQMFLVFQHQAAFPNDGVRYMEQENKHAVSLGNGRVCLVILSSCGGSDTA